MPPLLSIRDLCVRFRGRPVLHGLNLELAAGESLGLVGESGSGKSVTALALLRLLGPEATVSGSIVFDRRSLLELPQEAMRALRGRDIGIVFQEPMTALNPVLPIGRQVGEALTAHAPGTPRRQVRDRVVEALEAVSIPRAAERLGDYPHQFSGGQRQRILIAMALMNRPRLLIADEPTTALDVTVQAQILELLAGLRRRYSLSLLFISHDLAVVASVADRVLVLRQGEMLEEGSRQQLFSNPLHAYTRSLLGAVPTLETDRERPLATLDAASTPGGVLREREPGHWVRGLP